MIEARINYWLNEYRMKGIIPECIILGKSSYQSLVMEVSQKAGTPTLVNQYMGLHIVVIESRPLKNIVTVGLATKDCLEM